MFFQRKIYPAGLDISDYSIEILQLNSRKEVLAFHRTTLQKGIIVDGIIIKKKELTAKLKNVLQAFRKSSKFPKQLTNEVILSMPESRTLIHVFDMDKSVSKKDLSAAVDQEANGIIPMAKKQIYSDYQAIKNIENQGYSVLYAAISKEIADEYLETVRLAGFSPQALDIESASLARALLTPNTAAKKINSEANRIIMDIGARTTNISVFNQAGNLCLSVTIPIAGIHFTKSISADLNISEEEAEIQKCQSGLRKEGKTNNAYPTLDKIFGDIIIETKKIIDFYENKSGSVIEELVLAGGSSLLPELAPYLEEKLKKKIIPGDPLINIKTNKINIFKDNPILFANVIGLSLRGISQNPYESGINLLPKEARKKNISESISFFGRVFTVAVILLIIGLMVFNIVIIRRLAENKSVIENESISTTSELSPETKKDIIQAKVIIDENLGVGLNIRSGPDIFFPMIAVAEPEDAYLLLDEQNNWYKIKVDEVTEGWITSQYAKKIIDN